MDGYVWFMGVVFVIWGFWFPYLLQDYFDGAEMEKHIQDGVGIYENHTVQIVDLMHKDDEGYRYPVSVDGKHVFFCKTMEKALVDTKRYIDGMEY